MSKESCGEQIITGTESAVKSKMSGLWSSITSAFNYVSHQVVDNAIRENPKAIDELQQDIDTLPQRIATTAAGGIKSTAKDTIHAIANQDCSAIPKLAIDLIPASKLTKLAPEHSPSTHQKKLRENNSNDDDFSLVSLFSSKKKNQLQDSQQIPSNHPLYKSSEKKWAQEINRIEATVAQSNQHGLATLSAYDRLRVIECIKEKMERHAIFHNNKTEISVCASDAIEK